MNEHCSPHNRRAAPRISQDKSIETRYRGHRFRSRLEARWCVFFEHAGIPYDYELQGFVLDGAPYLPDFMLRGIGWFEIKGEEPADRRLYQKLADHTGDYVYVAAGGIPDPRGIFGGLSCFWPATQSLHELDRNSNMFLQCSHCGRAVITSDIYCTARGYCHAHDRCERARMLPPERALIAARSARFEHGECG